MMEIKFIGATETVTGSSYHLRAGDTRVLIDCGLYQGLKELRERNWRQFPVNPHDVDAVILTHAHIDHTGYLPLFVKKGFRGKVYSTSSTRDLCNILLPDSAHIQEEDAMFANKHKFSKHHPALPLYNIADAKEALKYFHTVEYGHPVSLAPDFTFEMFQAGHIVGSSIIKFTYDNKTITFSGDLGRQKAYMMKTPAVIQNSDYLVIESTYGNRLHSDEEPESVIADTINKTIDRGGKVLIPAFAVGRTQFLLLILYRLRNSGKIPNVPIFMDSPMAVEATKIFAGHLKDHNVSAEEVKSMMESVKFLATPQESKSLNDYRHPCIIISASGMATGGRVLHHLRFIAPVPENTILFAGYQAVGTRGRIIASGAKEIKLHGMMVPIRAEVSMLESISAHCDSDEMILWLKNFHRPPRTTFVTHGEPDAATALKVKIEESLGWNSVVPRYLESFEL